MVRAGCPGSPGCRVGVVVVAVTWSLAFPPSQSPAVVYQGEFYVCGIDEVWGVPLGTRFVGGMRTCSRSSRRWS